jgi:hypothetical protein
MAEPWTSNAPFATMASLSRSAMASTAKTSFSKMQTMLWSREAPATMSRPARSRWAVSSTTTGGLPGQAQMARLPQVMVALTTAGPPVTTTRRIPSCRISAWADSTVGSATQATRFSGPPAEVMASLRSCTCLRETFFAEGCTLKTTEFPLAITPMSLRRMVSVGFVVGVMAPMTPNGARSVSVRPWSPEKPPGGRARNASAVVGAVGRVRSGPA